MKTGDYIIKSDGSCEATIWRVTGIYLGALGHQDCVGLVAINRKEPSANGSTISEMLVPLELIESYLCETRHD